MTDKYMILVEGQAGRHYDIVELEWHSDRNKNISRYWDIGENDPDYEIVMKERENSACDVFFPVVDIEVGADMYGKIEFGSEPVRYTFNYHTDNTVYAGKRSIAVKGEQLEPWENMLYVTPRTAGPASFCIVKRMRVRPASQCMIRASIKCLSDNTAGMVRCYGLDSAGNREWIFDQRVNSRRPAEVQEPLKGTLSKDELKEAIIRTSSYLQRAVIRSEHSLFNEGIFSFYDREAGTYRLSPWMWHWGTSIYALLSAACQDFFNQNQQERLLRDAWGIGNTSLRFQVYNKEHVTDGFGTFRDDVRAAEPGMLEYITCGSDSNYLSGWGWMPLYQATGDGRYLSGAQKLAAATGRMLDTFDLPPQDYASLEADWTAHTLDESGFGTEGLAELYAEEPTEELKALIKTYIDAHIAKLERSDGMWDRAWLRREQRAEKLIYHTRAAAWAMEGLLSSAKVLPEGAYLSKAVRLAEHMLKNQQPDGHWNYRYNEKDATVAGVSDKGTAVWSILMSRLYDFTGETRYLEASRKALAWCLKNLYTGEDELARGAVEATSPQSAVIYRRWFPITCVYATAFICTAACMEYERMSGTYKPWNKLESSKQFNRFRK